MWWKGVLMLLVVGAGLWFFWPKKLSDQEQIQESLYNIVWGISDRDSGQVLSELSEKYVDQTGWKKKNIRAILFQQFQQKQSFSLQITPSEFTITPPTAEVTAKVVVLGGSMWNPNAESQTYLVNFAYQQEEDGVWRLQGHTREIWED